MKMAPTPRGQRGFSLVPLQAVWKEPRSYSGSSGSATPFSMAARRSLWMGAGAARWQGSTRSMAAGAGLQLIAIEFPAQLLVNMLGQQALAGEEIVWRGTRRGRR